MTLTKPPVETYQALPESCSDDKGPLRRATNRTRPCILCALLAATGSRRAAPAGSLPGELSTLQKRGTFYFALTCQAKTARVSAQREKIPE